MTHKEFDENIYCWKDFVTNFIKKKFKLSSDMIEDIVQDSFIKAYNYLAVNDITHSTHRTWICKVALNCALDKLRTKKNNNIIFESQFNDKEFANDFIESQKDDSVEFSTQVIETYTQKQILFDIFEKMKLKRPEIYQTFMVYLDVDDYNQICEIQNLPIGTIKSRINRARKFIQENISEEDLLTLT